MSKLHGNRIEVGTITTTDRDNLSSPPAGTVIWNSSTGTSQVYNGSAWKDMSSGVGLDSASGGTLVSPNPGGYEIRHFPSSTDFTYNSAGADSTLDILLVGGGGAGGERGGGGGGAGGLIYWSGFPLASYTGPTTFPIVIGSGGSGYQSTSQAGGQAGGSSKFGNPSTQPGIYLVAIGGGGGRSDSTNPRNNNPDTPSTPQHSRGGSGGGQHECTSPQVTDANGYQPNAPTIPANSRTYGHGNPGGRSNPGDASGSGCPLEGGGGGGASAAGENAPGPRAGNGGAGLGPPTFPWMPTSLGDSGYFAGGGGGGVHGPTTTGGGGGNGGGGASRGRTGPYDGYPGTNGTGGGGGGSSVNNSSSPNSTGGNGGNGICIIRYPAM